jgi:hypothetical protein
MWKEANVKHALQPTSRPRAAAMVLSGSALASRSSRRTDIARRSAFVLLAIAFAGACGAIDGKIGDPGASTPLLHAAGAGGSVGVGGDDAGSPSGTGDDSPGTTGTGGTTDPGAPDAGPVVTVNPCIAAGNCAPPVACGALSTVIGQWQNVAPSQFTSPVNMETYVVAVNPEDETVFAAAGNVTNGGACPSGMSCPSHGTGVYKSSDCGSTWAKVSTGTKSANFNNGGLWALVIDPVIPQTMYVANGYGSDPTIYRSMDGGVNWVELSPDSAHVVGNQSSVPSVQDVAIDPYNHLHLAVSFHENCSAPYNPLCLSQTTDGGNTWKEFNGPSSIPGWTITGWMEGSSLSILGATAYIFTSPAGTWYTGNGGTTWKQIIAQGFTGNYPGSTHIASDGTLYIGATNNNSPINIAYSRPDMDASPPFALAVGTPAVSALANAPPSTVIIDDGINLYAANTGGTPTQPFWTAPLSNPTAWKQMPDHICGPLICRGANQMAYDSVHHIVYSANWGAGLWRLAAR